MMIPNGQLIGRVSIGGDDLELDGVTAAVTIRFGRLDPSDAPTASTLQLDLVDLAASSRYRCGDDVELDLLDGSPRFRGQVTDLAQTFDPAAHLSLTATGNLARIARRRIGFGAWPQEAWSARVARVFAEAGWDAYTVELGSSDPPVAARAASGTSVTNELASLAATGSAAIIDLPDGSILVQAISARSTLDVPELELPPELTLYAPAWSQVLDLVNVADVTYGTLEDSHTVTSRNEDSVALFGERSGSSDSAFALQADAAAEGVRLVNRRGYPHWLTPTVQLSGLVTPRIGTLAHLVELPPGSPYGTSWQAVTEGWVDVLDGQSWLTVLQLSDPIRSALSLQWRNVPAEIAWLDVDPAAVWSDATTVPYLLGED